MSPIPTYQIIKRDLPPVQHIHKLFKEDLKKYPGLRLGQWFFNFYDKSGKPDSNLFYASDSRAYDLIIAKYYGDKP